MIITNHNNEKNMKSYAPVVFHIKYKNTHQKHDFPWTENKNLTFVCIQIILNFKLMNILK